MPEDLDGPLGEVPVMWWRNGDPEPERCARPSSRRMAL